MDLIKFAMLKSCPEADDSATVTVALVFVSSSLNLVKIRQREPMDALSRLLADKLLEEMVLSVGSRWTIDPCDLEVSIIIGGIDDMNVG
jgi:hypothetical protein